MSKRPRKSSKVLEAIASECGHESEGPGPCSRCKPPENLVNKGVIPKEWKHMPWDDIELKKHGRSRDEEEEDLDDRHLQSVEESMQRSTAVGEEELEVQVENWPRVKVTRKSGRRSPATDSVSAAEDEDGDGEGSMPKAVRRKKSPKQRRRSKKPSKVTSGRGKAQKKIVIPLKKVKRGKSVEITINLRIQLPKKARRSVK